MSLPNRAESGFSAGDESTGAGVSVGIYHRLTCKRARVSLFEYRTRAETYSATRWTGINHSPRFPSARRILLIFARAALRYKIYTTVMRINTNAIKTSRFWNGRGFMRQGLFLSAVKVWYNDFSICDITMSKSARELPSNELLQNFRKSVNIV